MKRFVVIFVFLLLLSCCLTGCGDQLGNDDAVLDIDKNSSFFSD